VTTLTGTIRPKSDPTAAATPISADGADYQAAYDALLDQVPDDHQLLRVLQG